MAFRDGALYVAEISRILRYDDIEASLRNPPEPVVVFDRFPTREPPRLEVHRLRARRLAVRAGRRALQRLRAGPRPLRADLHASSPTAAATRSSRAASATRVGFDWDPRTGELWFNEHGRDMMGDDMPSDELNHAPRAGLHFGFPYCHQGDTPDPEFGAKRPCSDFTPPALKQGGHVAPNGLRFYTGKMFPPEYRNRIFIAQHGSWNRSKKSGYRVMMVTLKDNKVERYEVFAEGWMENEQAWGRPVDLLVMPDGGAADLGRLCGRSLSGELRRRPITAAVRFAGYDGRGLRPRSQDRAQSGVRNANPASIPVNGLPIG